jgi:uncharacterized protein (DUF2249 family)
MTQTTQTTQTGAAEPIVLDVRTIPPYQRHPQIIGTIETLEPGGEILLVNDHDPVPLRGQLERLFGAALVWEYLAKGPDLWRVRLSRR